MASREYYSEVIDEMRKAQGKLTNALYSDLDRLAGAESNGTKVKVQEAYERGVNEAFNAIVALFEMHPLDLQEYLEAYELDDMKQFLKSENRVERVKQVQQTVRVMRAEELKVGDEVDTEFGTGIIIQKCDGDILGVFLPKKITTVNIKAHNVRKTGRHISIDYTKDFLELVEAMKGNE